MNKRTALLIVLGIVLAGVLIGIKLFTSVLSDRKAQEALIEEELQKRDARLSQLGERIESLSIEKSLLAEREAELEKKLKVFQGQIEEKTEKEQNLNNRAQELAQEKQQLAQALSETHESMQKKLRMTAQEAEQELERRRKEYAAMERESLVEITVLRRELESLSRDKEMLKNMTAELVDELNQTRSELIYSDMQDTEHKETDEDADDEDEDTEDPAEALPVEERFKQHYNQGLEHDRMGEHYQAIEEYQKALELMPRDPDLHYNMAIVYDDNIKNKEKAVFHYQRYLELSPNSHDRAEVQAWLAKAREDLKWQKKLN